MRIAWQRVWPLAVAPLVVAACGDFKRAHDTSIASGERSGEAPGSAGPEQAGTGAGTADDAGGLCRTASCELSCQARGYHTGSCVTAPCLWGICPLPKCECSPAGDDDDSYGRDLSDDEEYYDDTNWCGTEGWEGYYDDDSDGGYPRDEGDNCPDGHCYDERLEPPDPPYSGYPPGGYCPEGLNVTLPRIPLDVPGCDGGDCSDAGYEAANEQCDGIDNDGDSEVDEEFAERGLGCESGEGVCGNGVMACQFGVLVCMPRDEPQPEMCDGLDNDCDGETDEDDLQKGQTCSTAALGQCSQGQIDCCTPEVRLELSHYCLDCTVGSLACIPLTAPLPEACDGLDNDCDEMIDEPEEVRCWDGTRCLYGQCRNGCAAGECGFGQMCARFGGEDYCIGVCDDHACPEGQQCNPATGQCCAGGECPEATAMP